MNFLTWERAYSLYPDATFRHGYSANLNPEARSSIDAFSVFARSTLHFRDKNSLSDDYEVFESKIISLRTQKRNIEDSLCWSVPLRTSHIPTIRTKTGTIMKCGAVSSRGNGLQGGRWDLEGENADKFVRISIGS